jgi:hypothetical protein
MLRTPQVIAALLMMALSPAALAQKSSGYMDLDDVSSDYGTQLAVFRVMISKTEAICPQQTGIFGIGRNGGVTDIVAALRGFGGWRMDPAAAPDDFTYRRRLATDSCRIDIDISEQQKRDDEWMPLLSASRPNAISDDRSRKIDDPPPLSAAEAAAFDRHNNVRAHSGHLRQGWISTIKGVEGFEGAKDCFDALATFQIDQTGVMLLFPTGLKGELNRFFIERVDVDDNHSTLYLSRGSCRVGFTIGASILREGSWVPLPIAPFK